MKTTILKSLKDYQPNDDISSYLKKMIDIIKVICSNDISIVLDTLDNIEYPYDYPTYPIKLQFEDITQLRFFNITENIMLCFIYDNKYYKCFISNIDTNNNTVSVSDVHYLSSEKLNLYYLYLQGQRQGLFGLIRVIMYYYIKENTIDIFSKDYNNIEELENYFTDLLKEQVKRKQNFLIIR